MMNKVTCKIVLDTKSKEPEKRLFLSVTHLRQAYKYSLGLDYKLTKEQFENKNLKVTKEALSAAEPEKIRAEQIITSLGKDFTFATFKKRFKGKDIVIPKRTMTNKLLDVFDHYIEDHPQIAPGTIDSYKTVVNHLIAYDKNICITDITITFLNSFREYF